MFTGTKARGKGLIMKRMHAVLILSGLLTIAGLAPAQTGTKKKRALPHEFGNVIINNYSEKTGMAPVEFNHWLHRGLYTCRLCHVDLTFVMKAGATNIRAADNKRGFYCGACHNGKMTYRTRPIFEACLLQYRPEAAKKCERCHSAGTEVKREHDFYTFTEKFPKERFGNGIDWDKATSEGFIRPIDSIEGISVKKKQMKIQNDFSLNAKVEGMPDIIYSHAKHTVWCGCESCHPEIFVGVRKGLTKYSMVDIYQGKYCGVCHINVAFPLLDCQRCHTKAV
jgi:c(7)-type cytochrome triheme protein